MASRKHLIAVNRAIKVADLDERGLDGPTVELLRDLARRMDSAGPEGPPLNLLRSYLSATKDLQRAAARKAAAKPARAEPEPEAEEAPPAPLRAVEETPLEKLRNKRAREAG